MDRAGALVGLRKFVSVTPHDSTDIEVTRAIYVESTGDVAVIGEHDTVAVTIPGLFGGVWHPMRVTRILDTGTDATTVIVGR